MAVKTSSKNNNKFSQVSAAAKSFDTTNSTVNDRFNNYVILINYCYNKVFVKYLFDVFFPFSELLPLYVAYCYRNPHTYYVTVHEYLPLRIDKKKLFGFFI